MKLRSYAAALGCFISLSSIISASETITYSYDARGRLVKVERAGTVNNGVQTVYTHDKANNRKSVTVTGSGGSSGSTTADFSISDPMIVEGGQLVYTVTRSGVTTTAVSVNFVRGNGSAIAGSDWTGTSGSTGTLTFAANVNSSNVAVSTIDDALGEAPETVLIDLYGASSGATILKSRGTGTITDNDGAITITDANLVVLPGHTATYNCLRNATLSLCWLNGSAIYVYNSTTNPQFDPGYSLSPQTALKVESANYGTGVAP